MRTSLNHALAPLLAMAIIAAVAACSSQAPSPASAGSAGESAPAPGAPLQASVAAPESPVFNAGFAGPLANGTNINIYGRPTTSSKIIFTFSGADEGPVGVVCVVQGPAVTTIKDTSTLWDYVQYQDSPSKYGYINDAWIDDAANEIGNVAPAPECQGFPSAS